MPPPRRETRATTVVKRHDTASRSDYVDAAGAFDPRGFDDVASTRSFLLVVVAVHVFKTATHDAIDGEFEGGKDEIPSAFGLPTQGHYAANCCSC